MKKLAARLMGTVLSISLVSVAAKAEQRHIGLFDTNGNPLSLEVNKIPANLSVLPSGHLPNPDLKIYDRTRQRLGVTSAGIDQKVLKIAKGRLADAMKKVKSKTNLVALAKQIAPLYGVDPAYVIACILTEMTFNNYTEAALQDFIGKLAPTAMNFRDIATAKTVLKHPNVAKICRTDLMDYWSWMCVDMMWATSMAVSSGKTPMAAKNLISMGGFKEGFGHFLAPVSGTSYGPAQLQPIAAIKVSGDVARVSRGRFSKASLDTLDDVMNMIISGEGTVHVVSALIARSRVAYKIFAKVDTANNLGVEATLFNLGNEAYRAFMLNQTNTERAAKKLSPILPRENYFGWFAQEHEAAIRAFVNAN